MKRQLEHSLWQNVLDSIENWPQTTLKERQHHQRSRWIILFLYHTALSVSEVARTKSCDFILRRGRWRLLVTHGGEVAFELPISDALMSDFARYRVFYGLSPFPLAYDTTPAVMTISGDTTRHMTSSAIYSVAKDAFQRAALALEQGDGCASRALARFPAFLSTSTRSL
ncbi:hypothetical protein [Paraburkholderia humisilvae]|nr:hypothetical protein [Paraburkholderia humisilvae]